MDWPALERQILDLLIDKDLTDDEIVSELTKAAVWNGDPAPYPPTVKSARSRLTKAGVVLPVEGAHRDSKRHTPMKVWRRQPIGIVVEADMLF
jgi:hypothetical protein